jgi:hypothetical protein
LDLPYKFTAPNKESSKPSLPYRTLPADQIPAVLYGGNPPVKRDCHQDWQFMSRAELKSFFILTVAEVDNHTGWHTKPVRHFRSKVEVMETKWRGFCHENAGIAAFQSFDHRAGGAGRCIADDNAGIPAHILGSPDDWRGVGFSFIQNAGDEGEP